MDITLVGLPDEFASFQYSNVANGSVGSIHPPTTDLIDNHGNVSGDYLDFGCFDYFDTSLASGVDAGYNSWAGATTYFHRDFGTLANLDEWEVDGGDVTTQGLSFDFIDNGIQLHIDYTRAVSNLDRSETWTTQYTHRGINAGTVITTFSDNGMEIFGVNASGDLIIHKKYQP